MVGAAIRIAELPRRTLHNLVAGRVRYGDQGLFFQRADLQPLAVEKLVSVARIDIGARDVGLIRRQASECYLVCTRDQIIAYRGIRSRRFKAAEGKAVVLLRREKVDLRHPLILGPALNDPRRRVRPKRDARCRRGFRAENDTRGIGVKGAADKLAGIDRSVDLVVGDHGQAILRVGLQHRDAGVRGHTGLLSSLPGRERNRSGMRLGIRLGRKHS